MADNDVIEDCKMELATNSDVPATRILSFYGAKLGVGVNAMRKIVAESSGMPFTIAAYAGSRYVAAGMAA